MSAWDLPVTVDVNGQPFVVRSDFRAVLDALAALSDQELTQAEQLSVCLQILFPDWEQLPDAPAIDKILGYSCRRCPYLHWWEFIGAFHGIGRGLFSEVVNIRAKRAKGKRLEKHEQEFARENEELIRLSSARSAEEQAEKDRLLAELDG